MSKVWKNTPENFWSKTHPSESGCLEWAAQTTDRGYGRVSWRGKKRLAHRVAMYLHGGFSDLDADTCVLHKCDNRLCCNPQHLFLGTKQDNTRDAVAKGRQFIPDNRGARSGNAKLSGAQAKDIRECYTKGGVSQRKIASAYGVNQMSISKIVRGVSYSG